jgi:hypothetical protein
LKARSCPAYQACKTTIEYYGSTPNVILYEMAGHGSNNIKQLERYLRSFTFMHTDENKVKLM